MKKILAVVFSTLLLTSLGCQNNDSPAPTPPPADTIEKMREAAEDAADTAAEKTEAAAEKIGEALDTAGEAVKDAVDNLTGGDDEG